MNAPSSIASPRFDEIGDGTSNTLVMIASLFAPPIDPSLLVAAAAPDTFVAVALENDDEWTDDEKKSDCELAGGDPTIDDGFFVCWWENGDILVCPEGEDCYLEDTVVMPETWIGPHCRLKQAIIAPGLELPANFEIEQALVCRDRDPGRALAPGTERRDDLLIHSFDLHAV